MKYIIQISIIITLILATSCTRIYEDGKDLASAVKPDIKEICVDSLHSLLKSEADYFLLDIRQKDEYRKGNIDGSVHVPRGVLEFKIKDTMFWEDQFMFVPADTTRIILYCEKGSRSTLAADALQKIGYTNVSSLKGGWKLFNPDAASNPVQEDTGGCGG